MLLALPIILLCTYSYSNEAVYNFVSYSAIGLGPSALVTSSGVEKRSMTGGLRYIGSIESCIQNGPYSEMSADVRFYYGVKSNPIPALGVIESSGNNKYELINIRSNIGMYIYDSLTVASSSFIINSLMRSHLKLETSSLKDMSIFRNFHMLGIGFNILKYYLGNSMSFNFGIESSVFHPTTYCKYYEGGNDKKYVSFINQNAFMCWAKGRVSKEYIGAGIGLFIEGLIEYISIGSLIFNKNDSDSMKYINDFYRKNTFMTVSAGILVGYK